MSVHVSSWAWKQVVGDAGAKLVLLKLSDQANDRGECWPSQRTLARECEMGLATVKRKLELLYGLGLISAEPRRRDDGGDTSLLYRVGPARPVAQAELPPGSDRATPPAQLERPGSSPVSHHEPSEEPRTTSDDVVGRRSRKRAADPLWDSLVETFGPVAEKTNAHAKRNRAVGDLRKLGATVDGIAAALKAWPRLFDGASVTDVALSTHYPQLLQAAGWKGGAAPARTIVCDYCGGRGKHAEDCTRPTEAAAA